MRDFNLKFKDLNLCGGELLSYNKYPYVIDVSFDSFYVEVTIAKGFLFKENEYNVCIRDRTIEHWHPFGSYHERIVSFDCNKSNLIKTIQYAIDYGYKRFIKLKIFL
jgi:hypothetical protein